MSGILTLLSWIFFGDFGLLTLTPRYLFGVLFPVMIFVGFLAAFLQGPRVNHRLPLIVGLGCTTAALAAAENIKDDKLRRGTLWILVLLIPCSSQIAIIASFAAIVTLRVFLTYLVFVAIFGGTILLFLSKFYPFDVGGSVASNGVTAPARKGVAAKQASSLGAAVANLRPLSIIKDAFFSVTSTIPSFCIGTVIISVLTYCNVLDGISEIFAPWLQSTLHLPKEAASLFILNLFKRDFGSASLLAYAEAGAFDAVEMVVVMVMLTFCVPCFNTTVLLYKQEKLPMASFIWLGSLFVSLFFGRLVSAILFVCTV